MINVKRKTIRKALQIDELSEEDIQQIKNAEVPLEYSYLDQLMDSEDDKN